MPLFAASPNGFPRATHAVPSLAKTTSVPGSLTDVGAFGRTRVQFAPLSAEHQIPDGIVELVKPRTAANRMFCFPAARFTASAPIDGPPRKEESGLTAWNVLSCAQVAVGGAPAVIVHFRTPSP